MLAPWKESYDQPRKHIKNQRHYFANKGLTSQSYGSSSSHVRMWESDYKESWALKNWCFWTVVLEKTLERPLDCKEIQPVHLKGNQSWLFIGRTDAEAETPILWLPDARNWLIEKRQSCWERLMAGEGDDRGWDGWIPSLTQWTWVWVNSGRWQWTGRPVVLQSMGSESDMTDQLNWTDMLPSGSQSPAGSLLWSTCTHLALPLPPCDNSSDISSLNPSSSPATFVQPVHPHLTMGAYRPLRGLWSWQPQPSGFLSSDAWCNRTGLYGVFPGQTPSRISSAIALLCNI